MKSLLGVAFGKGSVVVFARDARGVTPIEYGLMAALIALSLTAGLTAFSTPINALYVQLSTPVEALHTTK